MRLTAKFFFFFVFLSAIATHAQISAFQHVVVIFQENRTPDNLFQGLCTAPFGTAASCSTAPTTSQYNIQTANWLDKNSTTGVIQPAPVALANSYDLSHSHTGFNNMCDLNTTTGVCRMDGAGSVGCSGTCPATPQFKFVDNSTGILNPYLNLATQYGWANYMFQTNQGPSFPAHQFIFGATSAPSATADHAGTFASENMSGTGLGAGCTADAGVLVQLINSSGVESPTNKIFPCFEHNTVADLLDPLNITWRYYAPGARSIWTAPNAINHICVPSGGLCTGTDWTNNVDLTPSDALVDIANCNLRSMNWIIPTGQNSDHANINTGGGPSWVASIVNAIGTSICTNPDGSSYWNSTAILIAWDDWGGWYDHEPPTFLASPEGGYQYGFRVPLIVVSAYTKAGLINNVRHDFGSIIRFVEHNFGITEGALTFADARATNDLSAFFNLTKAPRSFVAVSAPLSAASFINNKAPALPPDDDDDDDQ